MKRRNAYGEQLADLANLYFRMSEIPIRFCSKVEDWKRWETDCFRMLNGDRFRVFSSGAKIVCFDKLPGETLWEHLNRGTLTRRMVEAAASELRRAHQFRSEQLRGLWSHGDAGTGNFIYDEKTGRARLIDFEIIHDKSLPATARQADDLLVFLLDIMAAGPTREWLSFALRFLNTYDDLSVISELKNQLAPPSGMAWIWWGVRTSFANPAKVKQRLAKLRDVVANLRYYRTVAAKRARQRRRASISCQAIKLGMPIAKSRHRAIKEMAKAVSPGI
jgi:Ser/Thr protein kinase RdoA (MazF antagonist)